MRIYAVSTFVDGLTNTNILNKLPETYYMAQFSWINPVQRWTDRNSGHKCELIPVYDNNVIFSYITSFISSFLSYSFKKTIRQQIESRL